MIIFDLNQVVISNLMVQMGNHQNMEINLGLFRHMVLNTIRANVHRFRNEYGPEVVIACDAKNHWRKKEFPYYKANRREDQRASEVDWYAVYESINVIREELKKYFPYKVIYIDTAEADDIIAAFVYGFGAEVMFEDAEPILIVSGDKDFIQLQRYVNVKQYDPTNKRWIRDDYPERFLVEHIIRGDRSDGIPNILSPDSCLVSKVRQKPVQTKKLDVWLSQILEKKMSPVDVWDEDIAKNYERNKKLIDLREIPESIKDETLYQYNEQSVQTRARMFGYFVDKNLKNLMEHIGEF